MTFYTGQAPWSVKPAPAPRPVAHGMHHVRLDGVGDFEYPPLAKNFGAWHHHLTTTRAAWYARCDSDTFVNPTILAAALRAFGEGSTTYTGRKGLGRPFDRERFNITFPFAMGGTCEFLSAAAALIVVKELHVCLERSRREFAAMPDTHSDVELGRCLLHHGVHFSSHPRGNTIFRHVFTKALNHTAALPSLELGHLLSQNQNQQCATSILMLGPSGVQTTFGSLHPIKNADTALYLSNVMRGLMPMPSGLSVTPLVPMRMSWNWTMPCAHNPLMLSWVTACCNRKLFYSSTGNTSLHTAIQRPICTSDACSLRVPECPVSISHDHVAGAGAGVVLSAPATILASSHAVIVTLNGLDPRNSRVRQLALDLSLLLRTAAAHPVGLLQAVRGAHVYSSPIDTLSPGESGLRDSFRRAVEEAIARNASSLLVFEDDAVPRCDFEERWAEVLASQRCFGFLRDPGGILLLGASEWSHGPNARGANDTEKVKEEELDRPLCYNAHFRTSGTFAVLLSWHVLPHVLTWLSQSNRPIDHVYEYISMRGYPVRVAHPYLFVAMLKGAQSTVNEHRVGNSLSLMQSMAARGWGDASQYAWSVEDWGILNDSTATHNTAQVYCAHFWSELREQSS